jgi:hypothetical protein
MSITKLSEKIKEKQLSIKNDATLKTILETGKADNLTKEEIKALKTTKEFTKLTEDKQTKITEIFTARELTLSNNEKEIANTELNKKRTKETATNFFETNKETFTIVFDKIQSLVKDKTLETYITENKEEKDQTNKNYVENFKTMIEKYTGAEEIKGTDKTTISEIKLTTE